LDAWEEVLGRAAGGPAGAASLRASQDSPALGYLPTVMAVRAKELTLEGRTLHNVVVGGSSDGLTWRANVDATELNGYLEYRQPTGAGAGRLHARLARLAIAASAAREVEVLLHQQPDRLPALDIVVDDFDLRGKKLGRLEIDAVNRGAGTVSREGGVREWRLNKLNLSMPEASFSATGNWAALNAQPVAAGGPRPAPAAAGERRRSVMNFKLDIADSGQLLARFGMKDMVRRGKGRMEGQVSWLGSPLSLDYASMNGNFYVNVEAGQFLKADPGLAKLLGVLSLQSLPRRLALDFRDVFSEGFAFDFLRGDVTIQQGIAATNNLQMKGVNAAVLMEGKADIARETQDIKVVVVPEINAGTASLVATVINPAIGLGTFLAQMFLRQPLMRAATQEFHIDGTWADPRITRIDRRAAAEGRVDAANDPGTGRTN
ncbi:MAG TPA: AsmA-like C-terminal region-containing protein, partial [Ramlibacter sp.]|nr:AsmA-like C-terminal region-containing protein [Ramlibacter sp.]